MKRLWLSIFFSLLLLDSQLTLAGKDGDVIHRYMTDPKNRPSLETRDMKTGEMRLGLFRYNDFIYQSVDEKKDTINLSAKMMWKAGATQQHIILYCPYTHTGNQECATQHGYIRTQPEEKYFFWNANLVIIPDGEGFGESRHHMQMYLNQWLWARHEVDALRAAWRQRKKMIDEGRPHYPHLKDSIETVICGASQGGGTALATLRIMETTPCDKYYEPDCKSGQTLADYYNVSFANICCGPYDPSATLQTYFNDWYALNYPCVIPMVIKTMIASYPEVMAGLTEADFFTDEYMTLCKTKVDSILEGKESTPGGVNSVFKKYFATNEHTYNKESYDTHDVFITEFLRPEILDMSSPAAQKLIKCLAYNNVLQGNWKPTHWVKYYYAPNDNVVPYSNTKSLVDLFDPKKSSSKRDEHGQHEGACFNWMTTSWTERDYGTQHDHPVTKKYKVSTVDELKAALTTNLTEYKEIYLMNDIDLKDVKAPFSFDRDTPFVGIIDGQGHTLKNLNFGSSYKNKNYMGLVGAAGGLKPSNRSIFRNLTIEDFEVNGDKYVGLLAGYANYCNFKNITVINNRRVYANSHYCGNIAGCADHSNFVNITVKGNGCVYSGGKESSKKDAGDKAAGDEATDNDNHDLYAGAICGYAENSLFYKCNNSTAVYTQQTGGGGIVGKIKNSKVTKCINTGLVSTIENKNPNKKKVRR